MTQRAIPFLFMRGGTSRGPYFNAADLPDNQDDIAKTLLQVIGAGHPLNVDGIGGGNAVTNKVAILSRSDTDGVDIDYFFAQVSVTEQLVDFKPTCGNILSGVGPAAIEMELMAATDPVTEVRIKLVNTGALVVARLQTPGGFICYDGDTAIDGVPGTAARIDLQFMDVVGSATGKLLPTGNLRDRFDDVEVTCMDVAMPIVIARADAFGLSGYETVRQLENNVDFMTRIEGIRLSAGAAMGMGDVAKSVTPKFAILASAKSGGTIAARYFMPWQAHPTMAVTGAQCLASCAVLPGSVSDGLLLRPTNSPATINIEHPSGVIDVIVDYRVNGNDFDVHSAGLVRTARKLAAGHLFVPA
ncbi:4-oxalomesaconate tautomerase [Candidatus Puniceispirillum sp.]|nr:4-oxalomesaconate tautomerase [Candidatus Puniceispirillum sp.]